MKKDDALTRARAAIATLTAGASLTVLCVPINALACAACGCTLSSDWDSQSFMGEPGVQIDLREDYIDQGQLRHGTNAVSAASYPLPDQDELEKLTISRYSTLGVDATLSPNWGINLQLPIVDRTHSTIASGDVALSTSASDSLGDMRILARYQGLSDSHDYGLQFGLKLPTGSTSVNFATGPEAGGQLDRGLQPGTGTTDLILGVYHFGFLTDTLNYFVQGQVQSALDMANQYRPGASATVTAGVQYIGLPKITPQLQVNLRVVKRDSGAEADVLSTGGTLAYVSPGATYAISAEWHAYGFVQLPVYQRVNGLQLTPRATATLGIRYLF